VNLPHSKTKRNLRPKPAVVVAPISFSDETCFAVVGVTPRRLRQLIERHTIPHARDGKRVIVDADDWRRAMASLAAGGGAPANDLVGHDDDQPTSADAVLAKLGRRVARGPVR
jgi:hypothetical protein